jgi:hypothetical protein
MGRQKHLIRTTQSNPIRTGVGLRTTAGSTTVMSSDLIRFTIGLPSLA